MSTIGVDTGGTFTDLIYLRDDGGSKWPSARRRRLISRAASSMWSKPSTRAATSCATLDYFYHGTTVATNAMITGSGAKIGFVTTAGHRDALPMMRIIGRSAGRSETELKQYTYSDKPRADRSQSRGSRRC